MKSTRNMFSEPIFSSTHCETHAKACTRHCFEAENLAVMLSLFWRFLKGLIWENPPQFQYGKASFRQLNSKMYFNMFTTKLYVCRCNCFNIQDAIALQRSLYWPTQYIVANEYQTLHPSVGYWPFYAPLTKLTNSAVISLLGMAYQMNIGLQIGSQKDISFHLT